MGYAEAAFQGLKDFQKHTAKYAFDRLYNSADGTERFLIADEVGLGKTKVAAAVTGMAIDHLRAEGTPRVDVIYICANQAIARQNVDSLRQSLGIESQPLAKRITLLPHSLSSLDNEVNLIALTPGTSFSANSAEGVVEERIILYRMLRDAWGKLGSGVFRVFQGGVDSPGRFQELERGHPKPGVDHGIVERFHHAVGERGGPLFREYERVRDGLLRSSGTEAIKRRRAFVAELRSKLAHACLDALEPDLVILDEFQRFRDLMKTDNASGELAQRLFKYRDTRTILMSATPYKMYTLSHETDDDHYQDFLQTVRFLLGDSEETVRTLESSLRSFRLELPLAAGGGTISSLAIDRLSEQRQRIECILRRVMSRTERGAGADSGDPMLSIEEMDADLQADDVAAYLSAQKITAAADAPEIIEYWKSTPYLLSFMEQYRLADRMRHALDMEPEGEVAQLIRESSGLWLRPEMITSREKIPGGNGRMRALLGDLNDHNLHGLLWLPPLLPGYTLGRHFERARSATKRLVFSSWTMVPRAVSVMASYDAERHSIPDPGRAEHYLPQTLKIDRTSYPIFALLTPSAELADLGDPFRYPHGDATSLLEAVEERLRPRVAELTRGATTSGNPQNIWYAVIPLLLDDEGPNSVGWLLHFSDREATDDAEPTVWQSLVNRVVAGASDPASLGRPPSDLVQVLAALAVASPANASLRALSRITGIASSNPELKNEAVRAAWAFRSFFRTPVSEGLLQKVYRPTVPVGRRGYWRRILAYALEGGLSGVLDEFFHVMRGSEGVEVEAGNLVDRLCRALRLHSSNLDVVQWNDNGEKVSPHPFQMRQHFAHRYAGDRRSESDERAVQRLDDVRKAFNSPFWPFVLSTTSVGQEGLDFHWYCHAVVHWNLPSNPVDLEQREGRVHRYHGHAIRKNITQVVGEKALQQVRSETAGGELYNPWDKAYEIADQEFAGAGGLVPHWIFPHGDARIQRYAPVLPLSRDNDRMAALRRSLAIYRMVFGQPRQDDLLNFILREVPEGRRGEFTEALTIDLSPPVIGST